MVPYPCSRGGERKALGCSGFPLHYSRGPAKPRFFPTLSVARTISKGVCVFEILDLVGTSTTKAVPGTVERSTQPMTDPTVVERPQTRRKNAPY